MDELLNLLRSPVNEKKFTGLLLATKLLPAGDSGAVLAVHDAVGIAFINRLLLSLNGLQAAPASQEQQEVRQASAGLGLAVLAGFCRVPDLAASQDIIQDVPLLLKVLRSSGVQGILQPGRSGGRETEVGAVHDALEALTTIAAASEEGRLVCLQSGGIAAAATALQDAVLHHELAPMAVGFIGALLQGSSRYDLLSEQGEPLSAAVPPMAALLAATPPPQQHPLQPQPQAAADSASTQESVSITDLMAAAAAAQPAQEPTDTAAQEHADEAAKRAPPPVSVEDDAAARQLEVLHTLLLLLPPPEGSTLARLLAASAADHSSTWPGDLRKGVAAILRSRAPPATRQAALVLASAAVDLCGPSWLLGTAGEAKAKPGSFYQLIVELAAIETKVLLVDALRPTKPTHADGLERPTQGPTVQQNAEQILPVAFRLLEAAVEVLASDAEGAAALDAKVTDRALDTLDGAFEATLQYLEEVLSPGGPGDGPLALAALRALASYLADVPQAHSERVRKLLPSLLAVEGGAGPGGALAASAFLLPLLSQVAGPAARDAAAAAGGSREVDAWQATLQQPQVVLALARTAAEAALSAMGAVMPEDVAYTRSTLTDLCTLLLIPVSPANHRNAGAFAAEPQEPAATEATPRWLSEPRGAEQLEQLSSTVGAIAKFWTAQQMADTGPGTVPPSADIRLTLAAGALATSVAALAPASQQDAPLAASPSMQRLVSAALEQGLRVAIHLQRPPDVLSDEEMTELVDEVDELWHDTASASAVLAAHSAAFRAALADAAWVRDLAALPRAELRRHLATVQDAASPVERLLKALDRV